jgi:mRNA-degrading endonuclease RelE of RelBE toxin-antitoxin system
MDPRAAGVELRGRLKGTWRARAGGYRILYKVRGDGIVVESIRKRGEAYTRRRR